MSITVYAMDIQVAKANITCMPYLNRMLLIGENITEQMSLDTCKLKVHGEQDNWSKSSEYQF